MNLSLIHKEMIANLNLKGRDLFQSMNDLFNQKGRSLKDFIKHSPLIDAKRDKYFC